MPVTKYSSNGRSNFALSSFFLTHLKNRGGFVCFVKQFSTEKHFLFAFVASVLFCTSCGNSHDNFEGDFVEGNKKNTPQISNLRCSPEQFDRKNSLSIIEGETSEQTQYLMTFECIMDYQDDNADLSHLMVRFLSPEGYETDPIQLDLVGLEDQTEWVIQFKSELYVFGSGKLKIMLIVVDKENHKSNEINEYIEIL